MAATVQNGNGLVLAQQTTPTQACHMGPHGISQKASDYTAIPMCAEHHQQYGSKAPPGIDLPMLQAKLREAYEAQRTC